MPPAKITLFFCAGAIYTAHHLTEVSEMTGIGRKMPVTMLAFLVASLSIIGLPPLGGTGANGCWRSARSMRASRSLSAC